MVQHPQAMVRGPCRVRSLVQWLHLWSWVEDFCRGCLPMVAWWHFFSIFLGHKSVLEPLFCPIASNPLDSCLALIVILFRICLVKLWEVIRQISWCSPTMLSASLPCRFLWSHEFSTERLQYVQRLQRLSLAGQTGTGFGRIYMML